MTTTQLFSGMDVDAKSSSRVLAPPGGGSSNIFGHMQEDTKPAKASKPSDSDVLNQSEAPQPVAASPAHKDIRSRNQRQGDDSFRLFGDARSSSNVYPSKSRYHFSSPYDQSQNNETNTPRQARARTPYSLTSPFAQSSGEINPRSQNLSGNISETKNVSSISSPYAQISSTHIPSDIAKKQRKPGSGDSDSFSSIYGSKESGVQKQKSKNIRQSDSHDNVFGQNKADKQKPNVSRFRRSADSGAMRNLLGHESIYTPPKQNLHRYGVDKKPIDSSKQMISSLEQGNPRDPKPKFEADNYPSNSGPKKYSKDTDSKYENYKESNINQIPSYDNVTETDQSNYDEENCSEHTLSNVFTNDDSSSLHLTEKVQTDGVDEMTSEFSKVLGNYYDDLNPSRGQTQKKTITGGDAYNPITGEPIEDPKKREEEEEAEKKAASDSYKDHLAGQPQSSVAAAAAAAAPAPAEPSREFRSTRVSQPPGGRSTKLW